MNFKSLHKLFDLENFDGPLLSLFINRKGELFAFKWINVNSDSHRWLVFQTSLENVERFVSGELSEHGWLHQSCQPCFLVDITPKLEFKNISHHAAGALPDFAQPEKDVFFETAFCPDLEKVRGFLTAVMAAA